MSKIINLLSVPQDDRDATWLKEALQSAVELEHATLPPYLSGMWSIKSGSGTAYDLIHSVVLQEMLHMALACNMLTTIGGSPAIDQDGFVPTYPGGLPGGVRPSLTVTLQGLSLDYVHDVFMQIEYPEDGPVTLHKGVSFPTIGAFYDAIEAAYETLAASGAVTIAGTNQITTSIGSDSVFAINSIDDVKKAISEIKEQGEGTSTSPYDEDGNLSHYYKFAEIYNGKELEQQPDGSYAYTGADVPFPDVYPMAVVPEGGYGDKTTSFDNLYSQMLADLHSAWNGGGQDALGNAINVMFQLQGPAQTLMQEQISGSDQNYGPDFIYIAQS